MNYTKKLNKIIAVLLSATLLSACGWQLRGSLTLPEGVNSIYIADSSNSSNGVIALTIANILKQSNIDLATSSTDAQYSIYLSNERLDRRAISVGSDTLASEYELTHEVDYYIANSDTILAPTTSARVIRSYTYDRDDVVSKNEEEEIIRKEMRSNLASQILNRLRFLNAANIPTAASADDTTDAATAVATAASE